LVAFNRKGSRKNRQEARLRRGGAKRGGGFLLESPPNEKGRLFLGRAVTHAGRGTHYVEKEEANVKRPVGKEILLVRKSASGGLPSRGGLLAKGNYVRRVFLRGGEGAVLHKKKLNIPREEKRLKREKGLWQEGKGKSDEFS